MSKPRDRSAYSKRYYEQHREDILRRARERYRADPSRKREQARCYYYANRDMIRAYSQAYYQANREHLRRYGHQHNLRVQYLRRLNRWVDARLKEIE